MRLTRPLSGLLLAFLSCAAAIGGVPSEVGVGRAEATEFYTRKRVNGKWITGRFPKQGGAASVRARRTGEPAAGSVAPGVAVARAAAPAPRTEEMKAQLPPAPAVPLADDERLRALQQVLQARAADLVGAASQPLAPAEGTTGSIAPAQDPAALEPRSISFDFQSGMKTTLFSNGTSITEPFDIAVMRPFASRTPAAVSVGAAR